MAWLLAFLATAIGDLALSWNFDVERERMAAARFFMRLLGNDRLGLVAAKLLQVGLVLALAYPIVGAFGRPDLTKFVLIGGVFLNGFAVIWNLQSRDRRGE